KSKVSPGKFEAECKYCSKTWKCEEVPILEEYLASHCSNVPRLVLRKYMQKVGACKNISNKKRKLDKSTTGQTTITAFHDSKLNAGYDPPTREYLSKRLLETELCVINNKIEEDIMNQQNLTL
ncbi:3153_t:CDS:2, partial [Rhizophagus irregularis]